MAATKSLKKAAIEKAACGYLQAHIDHHDPTPFVQISARKRHIHPLPDFTQFEVEAVMPAAGANASVMMAVIVKMLFSAGGGLGMTWIRARFAAVCEDEEGNPSTTGRWGIVPSSYRPLPEKEEE